MDRNVCGVDRLVRLVVGSALLVAAVAIHARGRPSSRPARAARTAAGLWGVEILVTGLLQWCPLNRALGIDTCERDWPALVRDAVG